MPYHDGGNYHGGQNDDTHQNTKIIILFGNTALTIIFHFRVILFVTLLCKMRTAGRETREETLRHDNCVSGETIANFLYRGFQTRTL